MVRIFDVLGLSFKVVGSALIRIFPTTRNGPKDATASASFHPSYPLVASCSGQRKFLLSEDDGNPGSDVESDEESDEDQMRVGGERGAAPLSLFTPKIDNSLKVWRLPGNYVWYVDGYRWEGEAIEGEVAVRKEGETVVVEERTIVMEEEAVSMEEERITMQIE